MIKKYGEADEDGTLLVWPGGASFRFIPMKQGRIRSTRTHNKVQHRFRFHIFLKKHEGLIATTMKDINDTIDAFEGKSFQEVVLETQSENIEGTPLFRLFKIKWTPNPDVIEWVLSVHPKLRGEASKAVDEMKEKMIKQCGEEVNKFFKQEASNGRSQGQTPNNDADDDEEWFSKGSDSLILKSKGILEQGFEKAFERDPPTSNQAFSETDFSGAWGAKEEGYSMSSRTTTELSTITDQERNQKAQTATGKTYPDSGNQQAKTRCK